MNNEKLLAKEAMRLFRLPFPPSTEDAKDELLEEFKRVLRSRVENPDHLKAIIDWLMEHSQRCPTPGDVLGAAEAVKAPTKAKAPLGCEQCQGSGYVSFTKMVKVAGIPDPYEADFAKPCGCARGQFFQDEYDKHRNKPIGAAQDLG